MTQRIWPGFLQDYLSLKSLKLSGSFRFDGPLAAQYQLLPIYEDTEVCTEACVDLFEQMLPPNLQRFTYAPDLIATGDMPTELEGPYGDQLCCDVIDKGFENLLPVVKDRFPDLTNITLGSTLLYNRTFQSLQSRLCSQGVQLLKRKLMDEIKEVDHVENFVYVPSDRFKFSESADPREHREQEVEVKRRIAFTNCALFRARFL